MPCIKSWGIGGWIRINHICSRIHHRSYHSSKAPICHSFSSHYEQLSAASGKKTPHILGATFDALFGISSHVDSIITRASSHINILKDLAGTNSKVQKQETILITYKFIMQFISMYVGPIWFPNASKPIIQESKLS